MRNTFALLLTLALTASCTEQELLTPVEPVMPNSNMLIVPGMSIGASGSGESTPWYIPTPAATSIRATSRATSYPYVTTNADGKKSVIVSQDENGTSFAPMHAPWTQTPYHIDTDAANSIAYRFEVAQTDDGATAAEPWTNENGRCQLPWRRPTQQELTLITKMKALLEITPLQYTKAETYWASTTQRANTNFCIGVYANGTFNGWAKNNAAYKSSTRCVRDLFDNFTAAPGSNVATLWAYTSTNALASENLVPPTAIQNTSTGFALATSKYYPVDGTKKLYFYAHAPHNGATTTTGNDATATYSLGQADVMWAKDARGIARSIIPTQQEQPFFVFQHKLMRLQFKVVKDASYIHTNPVVTKIIAKNVNTKVNMKIKDGTTTFNTPGEISLGISTGYAITAAGNTLGQAMMIEPKSTVTLSVTAGGVTYPDITLTLTGEGAGTAGMSHLITLTFKQNAIVPTASAIDWITGGSADIGVV